MVGITALTLQQICWFEVKNYHKHDFEIEISF